MADFNVKVRFDDSGISTSTSTASPVLKKRGTELYIVAPTGFLRTTDKIKLARNTSGRWKSKSRRTSIIPNTGWLRPMMYGKAMIPLKLEFIKYMSNAYTEYWRVCVNLELQDNQGEVIPQSEVARMIYYYETENKKRTNKGKYVLVECRGGGAPVYLSGKQLGICVERNGVQITDYLTFTVDMRVKKNNDHGIPFINSVAIAKYSPRWTQSVRKRVRYWIKTGTNWGEEIGL